MRRDRFTIRRWQRLRSGNQLCDSLGGLFDTIEDLGQIQRAEQRRLTTVDIRAVRLIMQLSEKYMRGMSRTGLVDRRTGLINRIIGWAGRLRRYMLRNGGQRNRRQRCGRPSDCGMSRLIGGMTDINACAADKHTQLQR